MAATSIGGLSIEIGGDTAGLDKAHTHSQTVLRAISANIEKATAAAVDAFSAMSGSVPASMATASAAVVKHSDRAAAAMRGLSFVAGNFTAILAGLAAATIAIRFLQSMEAATRANINAFADLAKEADRLGMSVEQFSRLSFAAQYAGSSAQALSSALNTLALNSQKMDDETALSTRAFQALGIQVRDVSRDAAGMQQLLLQLASRFSLMESGVQRNALAAAVFGDSYKQLLPLIDRGAAGIQDLTEQSDRYSATVSAGATRASLEYTDAVRRLEVQATLAGQAISRELIPVYTWWARGSADFAEALNRSSVVGTSFRVVVAALHTSLQAVLVPVRLVHEGIGRLAEVLSRVVQGDFAGAFERFKETGTDVAKVFTDFAGTVVNNMAYVAPSLQGVADEFNRLNGVAGTNGWAASIVKNAPPAIKALGDTEKSMRDVTDANRAMFAELMRDTAIPLADKLLLLKMSLDAGQISYRQYSAAVAQAEAEQSRFNLAAGQMALDDLMQDQRLPIADKVDELNRLVREGVIGWREYQSAIQQTTAMGEQQTDALVSTMSRALTTVFNESKTAAIASALINTYQGISKAIATYPPPMSYAMAGLQAAMGFAQVRQIQNTNKGTRGGSPGVSGGASAAATASAATPSAPRESTLFVQGIDPRGMFSGEVVRALAGKLLDFQRDGGRVILAGA